MWPGSNAVSLIGEPQAAHCGPWLCVSSMALLPSVRRPEFTIKPTGRLRFMGIRCNDAYLNVIAFRAFEQPVFETNWTRCNAPSIIRVWQWEQRWRSIAVKNCGVEIMALPCMGRERYRTLSHRWSRMAEVIGLE
jgi:hypothetical protein